MVYGMTRRGFLAQALGTAWLSASFLERASLRAAQARAQSKKALPTLFDIEKLGDGVYGAVARGRTILNSNAIIFENTNDLLVVDSQAAPSAVYALLAQIRREVTAKPVRYVVLTHLHGDHTQGLPAYRHQSTPVSIVASTSTWSRLESTGAARLKSATDAAPKSLENFLAQASKAKNAEERAYWQDMAAQTREFIEEMRTVPVEIPDVTIDDHLVIHDQAHELRVFFRGRGHTAGDLFVYSPQAKVIATGDMLHSFFPYIGDGYPSEWPKTLRLVGELPFEKVAGGHGGMHPTPERLPQQCAYLEELCSVVAKAKGAGMPVERLLDTTPPASLKTLEQGGYGEYLVSQVKKHDYRVHLNTPGEVMTRYVRENLTAVYRNLDRA